MPCFAQNNSEGLKKCCATGSDATLSFVLKMGGQKQLATCSFLPVSPMRIYSPH